MCCKDVDWLCFSGLYALCNWSVLFISEQSYAQNTVVQVAASVRRAIPKLAKPILGLWYLAEHADIFWLLVLLNESHALPPLSTNLMEWDKQLVLKILPLKFWRVICSLFVHVMASSFIRYALFSIQVLQGCVYFGWDRDNFPHSS